MRFIKFIKWWWQGKDTFDRVLGIITLLFLVCLASSIWSGSLAILVFIWLIVAIIGWFVLCHLYKLFKETWQEFKEQNPTDDVLIIRRLKGEQSTDWPGP
jgi:beta-lactamase regulating signal transducer with metallopeptidase domain